VTVRVQLAADGAAGEPSPDPSHFHDAVAAWRRKVPVTDAEWQTLDAASRQRAFTVAGVADVELLSDVWRALDVAIAKGTSFNEFKAAIGDKLDDAWGGEEPWRLETVFRTNVQTAYNAGRYAQQTAPAVLKRRPYWKFSAILDSRTSPICSPLNGTVLPASDPWWQTHQPPLHHGCRSTVIALTAAQAGAVDDEGPEVAPADGFGEPPDLSAWQPDLTQYPAPLRAAYERAKAT
jgi:SPP1 gp7 family putative phage head morphogenesis protein